MAPPIPRPVQPESTYVDFLQSRRYAEPYSQIDAFASWYATRISEANDADQDRLRRESDAVRDILLGSVNRAIEKLVTIEADYPGRYSTASTLGTAYELAGDNENALHWISTGIERNPDSHYGTEWLHVRILETKIRQQVDPDYITENPIVEAAVESATGSLGIRIDGRLVGPDEVLDAPQFQLGERMLFVKPEDSVVADLLHTYAELDPAAGVAGLVSMAEEYGYSAADDAESAEQTWHYLRDTWFPAGVCVGVLALFVFLKSRSG